MPIPTSKPLSLSAVQTEYGGTNPIGMSEYRGLGNAPASGAIDLWGDFNGTSAWVGDLTLIDQSTSYLLGGSYASNVYTFNNGMVVTANRGTFIEVNTIDDPAGSYGPVLGSNYYNWAYSESLNSGFQGWNAAIGTTSLVFSGTNAWTDYVGGYLYVTVDDGTWDGCSGYSYNTSTRRDVVMTASGASNVTILVWSVDWSGKTDDDRTIKIPISNASGNITLNFDPVDSTRPATVPSGDFSVGGIPIKKIEIKET